MRKIMLTALVALSSLMALSFNAQAALICWDASGNTATWHVGDTVNPFNVLDDTGAYCLAYGNELAYLNANFTGLHGRKGNPVEGVKITTFTGDDAAFIIDNL
jgi:hypothetical protein